VNVVDVNATTKSKTIEEQVSRIESQEMQRVLLTGRKKSD
jgi:hypothetical protein